MSNTGVECNNFLSLLDRETNVGQLIPFAVLLLVVPKSGKLVLRGV